MEYLEHVVESFFCTFLYLRYKIYEIAYSILNYFYTQISLKQTFNTLENFWQICMWTKYVLCLAIHSL